MRFISNRGIMPAQSLVYTPGPSSAPLGPLSIIIIPCKCCQRSVWYKLGIMGDQTPKVKERRRKEKRGKDPKTPRTWVV